MANNISFFYYPFKQLLQENPFIITFNYLIIFFI